MDMLKKWDRASIEEKINDMEWDDEDKYNALPSNVTELFGREEFNKIERVIAVEIILEDHFFVHPEELKIQVTKIFDRRGRDDPDSIYRKSFTPSTGEMGYMSREFFKWFPGSQPFDGNGNIETDRDSTTEEFWGDMDVKWDEDMDYCTVDGSFARLLGVEDGTVVLGSTIQDTVFANHFFLHPEVYKPDGYCDSDESSCDSNGDKPCRF
jgi:hypothetical protein